MFRVCCVYHLFDCGNCLYGSLLGGGNHDFQNEPYYVRGGEESCQDVQGIVGDWLNCVEEMTVSHCVLDHGSYFGWLLDVPRVEGEWRF